MKSKSLNLGRWIFILAGMLMFALSSCTNDDFASADTFPELEPNDAIPQLQLEPQKDYQ